MGQSNCSFDGCINPRNAKGLCKAHRYQQRRGQTLTPLGSKNINVGKTCSGPECSRPAETKGMCRVHARQSREGKELTPIESRRKARPGTKCMFAGCGEKRNTWELCTGHYGQLMRGEDLAPLRGYEQYNLEVFWSNIEKKSDRECWGWSGRLMAGGYGYATMNGRGSTAHRVMWELVNGPIPDGLVVDHLCSNRACVNPQHLRCVKQQLNAADRAYFPRNTSGYKNVHYDKSRNQWVGSFHHHYKKVWVGRFDTPEEAAEAVRVRKLEIYGHEFRDSLDGTK